MKQNTTTRVDARTESDNDVCDSCGKPEWTTEKDGFDVCAWCGELACHSEI